MEKRFKVTQNVALLGIGTNVVLLVFKLAAGYAGRSQAMIADGFNSAGDVFASLLTLMGSRIASKPEDKTHPYGHGKAEYIFSMIISFSLLLVAYRTFFSSLDTVLHEGRVLLSWWLVGVAVVTIFAKMILFIYTRRAGKRENSLLILANSEDHRNDVFITGATLAGIFLSFIGFRQADGVAGVGISLWIFYTAIRIFLGAYSVLMDTGADEAFHGDLLKTVKSVEGVDHVDDLATKPVGVGYIIIVKISVPGGMSVNQSHGIAARIKQELLKFKGVAEVVVHVNPT